MILHFEFIKLLCTFSMAPASSIRKMFPRFYAIFRWSPQKRKFGVLHYWFCKQNIELEYQQLSH